MLKHIIDSLQGKHPISAQRSSHWPTIRKHHLANHPTCAVCGGTDKLEVHHIKPFHLDPTLELSLENLITLCESKKNGVNCHLFFGHKANFKSYNVDVIEDSKIWNDKLSNRPKS